MKLLMSAFELPLCLLCWWDLFVCLFVLTTNSYTYLLHFVALDCFLFFLNWNTFEFHVALEFYFLHFLWILFWKATCLHGSSCVEYHVDFILFMNKCFFLPFECLLACFICVLFFPFFSFGAALLCGSWGWWTWQPSCPSSLWLIGSQ